MSENDEYAVTDGVRKATSISRNSRQRGQFFERLLRSAGRNEMIWR